MARDRLAALLPHTAGPGWLHPSIHPRKDRTMDQTTPKHRATRSGPPYFSQSTGELYDDPSLAADPPPVHAIDTPHEGQAYRLVAGRHRDWGMNTGTIVPEILSRRSESGSTTLAAATAFWMVAGLLGLLAGFFHLAGCVA